MSNSPPGDASPLSERAKWQAFGVCVAVAALTILDISKVNLGLPSIEASLGAGSSQLQLIVAGYALAYGLALAPSGRLGDIHSRKTMFLIGLATFTGASIICATAPNITVLLIARIAQGLAAGIQMPQVLGLIQQLFQGEARSRAFGIFGGAVGLGTALGPALGGALVSAGGPEFGWRLQFWFNVPLGLVALLIAWRLLPTRQRHQRVHTELDLVGIALLGLTVLSLMLPFVFTTGQSSDDPRRWYLLIAAAALLPAFIAWERSYDRRGKSPLLKFSLFGHPSYRNGLLIVSAYYAALPSAFLLVSLYNQQGLHLSPILAGALTLPYTFVQTAVNFIGGRLIHRHGRQMIVIGIVVVIIGYAITAVAAVTMSPELQVWFISGGLALAGAGSGFVVAPNQAITLQDVPVSQAGVAGSMTQVGQRIGNSIGFALVVSTFYSTISREEGTTGVLTTFGHGYRNALLVVTVLFLAALAVAIIDLVGHRRRLRSAGAE